MTASKYSPLLGVPESDWQGLIGPIKSLCLDNFWRLNSGTDCVGSAARSPREREEGEGF